MEKIKELSFTLVQGPLFKYFFVFLVVALILILQAPDKYRLSKGKKVYAQAILVIWGCVTAALVAIGFWIIVETQGQDIVGWLLAIVFIGSGSYVFWLIVKLFRRLKS